MSYGLRLVNSKRIRGSTPKNPDWDSKGVSPLAAREKRGRVWEEERNLALNEVSLSLPNRGG